MHIAEMPSVPEILEKQKSTAPQAATQKTPEPNVAQKLSITSANDLANALQSSKEILLYSYYTSNIEVTEISDGVIKYFDRRGDADFAHKLATWLENKTGHAWQLQRRRTSKPLRNKRKKNWNQTRWSQVQWICLPMRKSLALNKQGDIK